MDCYHCYALTKSSPGHDGYYYFKLIDPINLEDK